MAREFLAGEADGGPCLLRCRRTGHRRARASDQSALGRRGSGPVPGPRPASRHAAERPEGDRLRRAASPAGGPAQHQRRPAGAEWTDRRRRARDRSGRGVSRLGRQFLHRLLVRRRPREFPPDRRTAGRPVATTWRKRFGHVSCERVCSGLGIANIYDYLRDADPASEPARLCRRIGACARPDAADRAGRPGRSVRQSAGRGDAGDLRVDPGRRGEQPGAQGAGDGRGVSGGRDPDRMSCRS